MGVKYIVQGAECKCQFGTTPDKLKVNTQSSVYLNDNGGSTKLEATSSDIGSTFEKNTFGSCKKQNNNPCVAQITQWSNPEEQSIEGGGCLLTEKSKATCPIGGTDCITIIYHGQQAEASSQNVKNVDSEIQSQINPFVDVEMLERDLKTEINLNS